MRVSVIEHRIRIWLFTGASYALPNDRTLKRVHGFFCASLERARRCAGSPGRSPLGNVSQANARRKTNRQKRALSLITPYPLPKHKRKTKRIASA
jgi:hypothetical protein